jgi:hypothetical protein
MDWLEQSVEQNLDDIFAMIGVNTYMRETEKQATSLSDGPPLPFDGPNWRDSLALGALGMTAPAAVAGYGAMTAPEGRRMHGAASAVTRLPFLGAGALGGLGLGTAAGLPLAAAIEPRSKLLAKLVGAGLPIAGGLAGLRLGDYLGKAMAPGPRELGLGDVESAKKEEKQAADSSLAAYVKTAVDGAQANPMLTAGLGGAGVGGLGMLAANAMNPDEDERNLPLAALQGAALGGGLGLGGAALYNYAPKLLEGLKTTPETQAITDQIEAAERASGSTTKQFFNNYVADPAAYAAAGAVNGAVNGVVSPLTQPIQQVGNLDLRALPSAAGAAAMYGGGLHAAHRGMQGLQGKLVSQNPEDYYRGAQRILDYRPSGDKLTMWDSIRGLFGGNRPPELRSSKELQPFLEGLASKRRGFDAPAIRDMIAGARAGKTMDVRPGNLGVRMGGASHTMQSPITPQQFAAIGASAPRARLRAAGRGILPGLGLGLAGLATQRLFQSPAPAAPPTASP